MYAKFSGDISFWILAMVWKAEGMGAFCPPPHLARVNLGLGYVRLSWTICALVKFGWVLLIFFGWKHLDEDLRYEKMSWEPRLGLTASFSQVNWPDTDQSSSTAQEPGPRMADWGSPRVTWVPPGWVYFLEIMGTTRSVPVCCYFLLSRSAAVWGCTSEVTHRHRVRLWFCFYLIVLFDDKRVPVLM